MIKILGPRRVGTEQPQQFELVYRDFENASQGYFQTTMYGTEAVLRASLQQCEVAEVDINNLFQHAR
jgi:hypothetical protein